MMELCTSSLLQPLVWVSPPPPPPPPPVGSHPLLQTSNSGTAGKLLFTKRKFRKSWKICPFLPPFWYVLWQFYEVSLFTSFIFPFISKKNSVFPPYFLLLHWPSWLLSFIFLSHNSNTNYFLPNSFPNSENPFPLILAASIIFLSEKPESS